MVWGSRAGLAVAGVILLHEVLARFVVLPDLRPLLGILLVTAMAVGAAAGALLGPHSASRVAERAGEIVGRPSLFLALQAPPTRLHPLLLHDALRMVEESRHSARPVAPLSLRALPLGVLGAVLLLIAPGRRISDNPLQPSPKAPPALTREDLRNVLSPEERRRVEQALARLRRGRLTGNEARRTLDLLTKRRDRAGGDMDRLARRLAEDGLLAPLSDALLGRTSRSPRSVLREVVSRLSHAGPETRMRSGQRLLGLALEIRDGSLAARLRSAGRALIEGHGEDAAEPLLALGRHLKPLPADVRALADVTVTIEDALSGGGLPGSNPRKRRGSPGSSPVSRAAVSTSPLSRVAGREDPRREAILAAYFR